MGLSEIAILKIKGVVLVENELLLDILRGQAAKMFEELKMISKLYPNNGEKGREAESILRKFLTEVIPKKWEVGTGFVVDAKNNKSNQTDIFIYANEKSPYYRGYEISLIPIQYLASAIEVKMKLTTDELIDSMVKFEKIDDMFNENGCDGKRPLNILFCYSSNIKLSKIFDYLHHPEIFEKEIKKAGGSFKKTIDLVCVLDRGVVVKQKARDAYLPVPWYEVKGAPEKKGRKEASEVAWPYVFYHFYSELMNHLNDFTPSSHPYDMWTLK